MTEHQFSVLIADDEAAIRNGLCEAVPWSDYQAKVIGTAQDGRQALALLRSCQPDLAVIDIKMPGMNGLDVIRQCREEELPTRFLILSGYGDFTFAQKAIQYGAKGYFLKPLKIPELKAWLSTHFTEILAEKKISTANAHIRDLQQSAGIFFLNQLLTSEIRSASQIEQQLSILNLNIQNSRCQVIAAARIAASVDPQQQSEQLEQLRDLLQQALLEIPHELVLHPERCLVILNPPPLDAIEERPSLRESLAEVHRRYQSLYPERVCLAIGEPSPDLTSLNRSYQSALQALSYHIYCLPEDLYDSSMICQQMPVLTTPGDTLPCVEEILRSHSKGITAFCDAWFSSLFFVPLPPPDYLRGMCIQLLSKIRLQLLNRVPDIIPYPTVIPEEIQRLHEAKQLREFISSTLLEASERYRIRAREADPVIEAAKEYIQTHLSSNIKAKDIAAQVNLSESYFTIYFKNKTGQNFRDYILEVRTEYAKELLSKRTLSISEIAYATGYQDHRSFSRAFKNVTGMSPSDYQNL